MINIGWESTSEALTMGRTLFPLLSILITFALLTGCQGNPASPDVDQQTVPDTVGTQQSSQSHNLMGYYQFSINTGSAEIDVIPLRSNQWHFNLTGILNATMGVSAVGVPSEHDPPNGLFVFDVTLSHPFATKPQFAGFDVKGILMAPGSLAVGALLFSDADETRLENADGYTRWWNPTEFTTPGMFGYTDGLLANATGPQLTAMVNPYKLFADKLELLDGLVYVSSEPLDSDEGRAVFKAGESNSRRYYIRFPMDPGPQVVYGYAVDCAWALPAPNPPTEVPDNFPMEANQPEAYRVVLQQTANSLYYDTESGTSGGIVQFQINVHDWQGQDAGDIVTEISSVNIAVPGLPSGIDTATFLNQTADKARYSSLVGGTGGPSGPGELLAVAEVLSSDGSEYKQAGAPAPEESIASYQAITLEVTDPDCTADTNNDFSEAFDLDLNSPTIDQMCAPSDYRDFFKMTIPVGNIVSGEVRLYCNPEPTKFALYDESEILITEETVSSGGAFIDLEAEGVMPGVYYLRVLTQTADEAFLYAIIPEITLEDVTPSSPTLVTPEGLYLYPKWIETHGDYVYAANDNGLWIYEWTECNSHQFVSYTPVDMQIDPTLAWPDIYYYRKAVADENTIGHIDVTDPQNPVITETGLGTQTWFVNTLLAEDDYLYVALSTMTTDLIKIYDIATYPNMPVFHSDLAPSEAVYELGFVYADPGPDYYLITRMTIPAPTIAAYNITDKSAIPAPISTNWGATTSIHEFETDGEFIYISYFSGASDYIIVMQLVGGTPVYQGDLILPNKASNLSADGNYLYYIDYNYTLQVIDVSVPATPANVNGVSIGGMYVYDMATMGSWLMLAQGSGGISGYNVTNPLNIGGCGDEVGLGWVSDWAAQGDYLYTAEGGGAYNRVKSVDVSDPGSAFVVDELAVGNDLYHVEVLGDKMVCLISSVAVYTVDCSDPANLTNITDFNNGTTITGFGMTADALYLGYINNNVDIYDLSVWPAMLNINSFLMTAQPHGFLFDDNYMYIKASDGIHIYLISNPLNPVFVTVYSPVESVREYEIDGNYLYIATGSALEIVDISLPQTPTLVTSVPHPDAPHGQYLAIGEQFAIIQPYYTEPPPVFWIWPPDDPQFYGDLYDVSYAIKPNDVLLHNGYYYENDAAGGIRIWELY